jgi:hypothetical protein
MLGEYAASHVQQIQKALVQMNLQLHNVVSDVTGVTGMKSCGRFSTANAIRTCSHSIAITGARPRLRRSRAV